MGWRWRTRPGPTFSPLRRRGRLRQPARPSGCTSSSGRSSSDLQRWSLSPTVISEASSRFLIRSPTTRQTPPSIQVVPAAALLAHEDVPISGRNFEAKAGQMTELYGPAAVLPHGWPYDIHTFAEVSPLLTAAAYRVIAQYLRRHDTLSLR